MIYGYLRVSTDKQDTEVQKQGIISLAEKNGWTIDGWITDDGVSGTKDPEKRQLGKLMKMCNEEDTIICSELSRLGRRLLMVMSILEYCMKHKIMIYTVKDNFVLGDNIQSTVLAFAFSLAAQIERDMISLRTIEGLKLKKLQGVLLGNRRGVEMQGKVDESLLKKMKDLFDKGYSLNKIAGKVKLHRHTVGYHLSKAGYYKGQVIGYKITMKSGESFNVTPKNCKEFGFTYSFIKDAAINGNENLKFLGFTEIQPIIDQKDTYNPKQFYIKSEHNLLNHDHIETLVEKGLTIPDIHKAINEVVDYFTLYDYISGDTDLSNIYRKKGHLKVKSQREKY